MRIHLMENRPARGWAVFGGYWPRGCVQGELFSLTKEAGEPVPLQSEVTARWPDGSVKWSRHIARADRLGEDGELTPGGAEQPRGLTVDETDDGWTVRGEAVSLTVPKSGDCVAVDGRRQARTAFDRVYPVLMIAHVDEREDGSSASSGSGRWKQRGLWRRCSALKASMWRTAWRRCRS